MNVGLTFTIGAKDLASKVLKGVGSAIRDTFVVAGGQLLASGIVKAMNGLRSFVNMAFEAEAANTALDSSLRGLGIYTPQLSQSFQNLASAIQNETGISDENTKSNIAQLLTLGVMPEKIGAAARAVASLTAVGKDNQSAMLAVGKMLEGDLSGFERLSPAVKNATTIHEKFIEVQKLLSAGYEQQQAKLETVGGAWEALKERLGDAIEDMGLAIFQGAGLGKTFGDMQAKVGAFLEGSQWKEFLKSIESGAKFAKELFDNITNQGGAFESFKAIASLISSAFVDGAQSAVEIISAKLGESTLGKGAKLFGQIAMLGGREFKVGKQDDLSRVDRAINKITETANAQRAKQTAGNNNLWEVDPSFNAAYKRDLKRRAEKANSMETAQSIAESEKLALAKEETELKKKLNSSIEKQVSAIEENIAGYGQQKSKEEQQRKALERYQMLKAEFIDPTKRTERIKAERLAEETFTQMQLEEAAIRQKFSQLGGSFKPSEREQQVIDMVKAREEAGGISEDYSKETAENTRNLAEKIDSLLKIGNKG